MKLAWIVVARRSASRVRCVCGKRSSVPSFPPVVAKENREYKCLFVSQSARNPSPWHREYASSSGQTTYPTHESYIYISYGIFYVCYNTRFGNKKMYHPLRWENFFYSMENCSPCKFSAIKREGKIRLLIYVYIVCVCACVCNARFSGRNRIRKPSAFVNDHIRSLSDDALVFDVLHTR